MDTKSRTVITTYVGNTNKGMARHVIFYQLKRKMESRLIVTMDTCSFGHTNITLRKTKIYQVGPTKNEKF